MAIKLKRASDSGILCTLAVRASQFWDWIDARDIDKHVVSLAILCGTYSIVTWAMGFAEAHPEIDGLHMAAIIGAVTGPYSLLQGAAIGFYFAARKT